jgi:HEXXH motif-containing protein
MLAVTLAHEVQHAKLSALQDIVPMIRESGGEDRHYAPWRDDPRPLGGLLQGIYAHLAVVAFWHRQRLLDEGLPQLRAHTEFARWREATAHVTRTVLASDRLTTAGTEFVTGLSHALAPYLAEPVPEQVLKEVRRKARDHRARWLREHGEAVRS